MEISFSELRCKEVINLYDGKRLGRIVDISFNKDSGMVLGFIVPAEKKLFKKNEDIFIPLCNIKKIGEDVLLVKLSPIEEDIKKPKLTEKQIEENKIYARYKRTPSKEK